MRFDAILAQGLDLLQRQGRFSYRALKRCFDLDDAYLKDLKAEIIKAQRLAIDWVDPSTLELLSLLLDQGPTAPMLTLLTGRPEFRPPWGFRTHLTPITLNRLPRTQVAVMVERVVGGKAPPAEVLQQVVARTDGGPLDRKSVV